ncbi:MAG TPA: hypothetical protein VII73_01485 [Caulobacteraceae bacterium]
MAVFSAFALVAAAHGAWAQQAPSRTLTEDFVAQARSASPATSHRTLEWDARKARWGLKFDMEQRTDRGVVFQDVQPGVFYRLTPRLHIGGAVSLGEDQVQIAPGGQPLAPPPRVRLETTFKF